MSAVANIVLNDAQATPVAHTFIPLGMDPKGAWWWEDQTGSDAIGYNRISMQLVRPPLAANGVSSKERTARVKIGIYIPILEVLSGSDSGYTPSPTVAYTPRVTMEFIINERATLLTRKNMRKYADFLLAETQLTDMIENLRNVF